MSINFPDTPTLNQVFLDTGSGRTWKWDGEKWVAQSDQLTTENIANNAITDIKLRDSAAYSVIGRSAATSGDPADIVAGTAQHVLKRGTSALEFGQVTADGIADSTITAAKINVATPGTTGQLLAANTSAAAGWEWQTLTTFTMPSGSITAYAGVNAPSGWLLCNGSSYSRTDPLYSALFATFATTFTAATTTSGSTTVTGLSGMASATHVGWGIAGTNIPSGATITSVNSSTSVTISASATATASGTANIAISPWGFTGSSNTSTFNVPNLKGRTPIGLYSDEPTYSSPNQIIFDNANDPLTRLGLTGGAKRHTISTSELPSHSHASKFHTTAVEISYGYYTPNPSTSTHFLNEGVGGAFGGRVLVSEVAGREDSNADTYPTMVENTGSSTRHQNMQPFIVVNYIIKL